MKNNRLYLSFLTTFGGRSIPDNLSAEQYGTWIMGCDACQDACPYNKRHSWNEGEDFPFPARSSRSSFVLDAVCKDFLLKSSK